MLLSRGANVHLGLSSGFSPLMAAAQNGREGVVSMLLEKGANVNERRDDGATALSLAEEYGRLVVARMLLGKNAATALEDPNDPFRYPDPRRPPRRSMRPASAGAGVKSQLSQASKVLSRLGGVRGGPLDVSLTPSPGPTPGSPSP